MEVFSPELWGGRQGNHLPEAQRHQTPAYIPWRVVLCLQPPALKFCSFLHNPDPGPKQPWGQIESSWWLVRAEEGNQREATSERGDEELLLSTAWKTRAHSLSCRLLSS